MNCAICGIRKPKRQCPGVNGAICALCCGTERERTIDCPIACVHLKEGHRHEKPPGLDPATLPNGDIRIPDSFLQEHEWLLVLTGSAVADGALQAAGTTDYDIREALASLIAVYGGPPGLLTAEVQAENAFAENMKQAVQSRVTEMRQRMADAGAKAELDDSTIVGALVFLQRLEYANNNGRKYSRAFFDFLMQFHVPARDLAEEEGIV